MLISLKIKWSNVASVAILRNNTNKRPGVRIPNNDIRFTTEQKAA